MLESYLNCDTTSITTNTKSNNNMSSSTSTGTAIDLNNLFKFPPPPSLLPSSQHMSSTSDMETNSDTSADDYNILSKSKKITSSNKSNSAHVNTTNIVQNSTNTLLPPIGVFWDIENCQVPRGRSALTVAQTIRDKFFEGYREVEFLVVCDVKKENTQIIQELNDAQVNLIHVSSTCKNAADQKLRQSIRRFADIHQAPAAIILISGDVNFAADLSDLRHRKKMHVILLHNDRCSESLILCASEHHDFTTLVSNLPLRGSTNKLTSTGPAEVLVTGLPQGLDHSRIRNRLKRLSENCGGRVGIITDFATTIRFPSFEFALRAQKRIDQEQVFGSKIHVGYPVIVQPSPSNQQRSGGSGRRHYNSEGEYGGGDHPFNGFGGGGNQENIQDPTNNFQQLWHSNNKSSFQNYRSNNNNNRPVLTANNNNTNGNSGHYCSSKNSSGGGSSNGNTFPTNSSQPITILKRCSPLPSTSDLNNGVFSVNTSIPPPPLLNLPLRTNNTSSNHNGQQQQQQQQNGSLNERILPHNFHIQNILPDLVLPSESHRPSSYKSRTKRYFHPIQPSSSLNNTSLSHNSTNGANNIPVELHVTNLDQNIDAKELKHILTSCFQEHVPVLHVSVFLQNDGTYAACVKLKNLQHAQYAISQLHRKKIGFKRIIISYSHSGLAHSPILLRSQIISLLQEVPTYKLPLFKFREMFEMRYSTSISVSELYRLKDVCSITEEKNGRTISLNPDHRASLTPSPVNRQSNSTPLLEQPYCTVHFKLGGKHNSSSVSLSDDKGWAELEASVLPNVKISLKIFSEQVHSLIDSHNGALPLLSFSDCYESQFGPLPVDEGGVPLEHLVTCIKGAELVLNNYAGIKYIRKGDSQFVSTPHDDTGSSEVSPCVSPSLQNQMTLLCRELVDLIKTFPHCQMIFNKFIPAYHHHFGRQCRVADYGFTKLMDLLEAIPHVVQVIGEGSRRLITLSHRAQMRRFTSDLLRTLKSVPNKQCTMSTFSTVFQRVHNRNFDPVDYGLSSLEDLLANVPENTIVVQPCVDSDDTLIAVPKREQTCEEIERTKKFSREVVEVLSHMPHYSILFNKFIPSYHHHYGHQCRVSDFGFTKLIELFESIPEVVTIEDDIEDRRITLTINEKLGVLKEQIKTLITIRAPITLDNLNASFSWQYGYPLRPVCYNCESLEELIKKLEPNIKVQDRKLIIMDDNLVGLKIFRIFIEYHNNSKILLNDFINIYKKLYKQSITFDEIKSNTTYVKVINKNNNIFITLTSLQLFAREVYQLLYNYDGKISLNNFEHLYFKKYQTAIQCAQYGYQTLTALLSAIPDVVTFKCKSKPKIIILNKSLATVGIQLPRESNSHHNGDSQQSHKSDSEMNSKHHNNNNKYFTDENQNKYRKHSYSGASHNSSMNHNPQPTRHGSLPNSNHPSSDHSGHPFINLPDFKIHPDTFTCTPMTSPYKGLPPSIMAPVPSELPLPSFNLNL